MMCAVGTKPVISHLFQVLKLASVLCQSKNWCSQTEQENGLAIRDWSTGNDIDYLSCVTWGWGCYIIIF